ncbi:hypothetical protein [Streptomyces sp. CC224B]|uniref:hypothetical protein n=1 Tax=Streptomyces sp. CC224B TaxID=3044571 RepID=UPI0024A8D59E|nr:hypothetical protein [Streptomyces sp. CC224B]
MATPASNSTWTVTWTGNNIWGRVFPHKVTTDSQDTAHVLFNLLNNARKARVQVLDPAGQPWDPSMRPPAPDADA